ncbi:DmsE family decaheme c-type cytochrome [Candidatus Ferrigenium straubiae]|uniref:DmsE family decaheme c-type cytochrome n=1 Tax=Candidatus Ferrigenium straubiae TaxID=2919506 RepID=UPI003F4AECB6
MGRGAALVGFVMLLLGLSAGRMALAAEPAAAAQNAAGYVGEKVCATCHDVQSNVFGHTLHAKVFRENPRNQMEKQVCEACHGPGSIHAENPTDKSAIIGFSREWGTPAEKQTSTCLSCHKGGNRLYWSGSTHDTNKLSCSDCHNPMAKFSPGGLLKKASITETCQSCHKQQQSEFRRRSHMPVPEGKMSCVDCHNPHGSVTKPLLKAKSVNDICYTCHAEKRGPFLWEHAPAKESCLTCHAAHGSNQDKLLNVARPFLCQQCHQSGHQFNFINNQDTVPGIAIGGGQNSNRALGRSCQSCHSQIHGSNHPSGARFQR